MDQISNKLHVLEKKVTSLQSIRSPFSSVKVFIISWGKYVVL